MRRLVLLVALGLLAALVAVRAADPWPVKAVRESYFDLLQRLAPRQLEPGIPVRVIDIDEASLAALGQWPWPRYRMAEIVERLTALGAASVSFDVIFAEPDRLSAARLVDDPLVRAAAGSAPWLESLASVDNDRVFADAMLQGFVSLGTASAGAAGSTDTRTLAGFVEVGPAPSAYLAQMPTTTPIVPMLEEAALGLGAINVSPEGNDSGIVRTVPLVWAGPNGPIPALAVEAIRLALGESTYVLMGNEDTSGLSFLRVAGYDIPTDDDGQLRVRYRRDDPSLYVSAVDLLNPELTEALLPAIEGHVVLIGTSAAGLLDIRTTALGESVPGVSIHAQIIEQILTDTYLIRSDLIGGFEILALILIGVIVSVVMAVTTAGGSLLAGTSAGALLLSSSWFMFNRMGVLFDVTFPMLGGFLAFSGLAMLQFVASDREKRLIRRSFSKYVSEDVLGEIEKRGHSLELGGEVREVTILFSDIRGFTPLSESMPAHDLVALLNALFTDLTDEILKTRGTIDKYVGDSIMAFWNAPLDMPDHPVAACRATLAMRAALARFNAARQAQGLRTIDVAFGLASGSACVGNMGSRARYNYSVIGETVNQAARIEANCRHVAFDILVSDEVARAVPGFAMLEAGDLALKGVSDRIPVAIAVGDEAMAASPAFVRLREMHGALLAGLASGQDDAELRARCAEAGEALCPGLAGFYDRLPGRIADFIADAPGGDAVSGRPARQSGRLAAQ
ncbi:CHASE2 domain-containing protein [Palleronia sp. KMU-117]|uniref:CHASE2 domain-containing protein n=1 Tax=Palleronia sp. KMU-117 TaxID=3434108 RepID=UPI003D7222CC